MERQPAAQPEEPARKAGGPQRDEPVETSLTPIGAEAFGYEEARHLLWRAGFGGTPAQIQTLVGWGPERAVEYLLAPDDVRESATKGDLFDKDIMRPPTDEERRMIQQARRSRDEDALAKVQLERQRRQGLDRRQMVDVQKWWLKQMVETPDPLREKMTLLWHGHFATSYRTIENSYHMFVQNELFRAHATGNFGRLLGAIVRDPAMIAYLDNNDSRKGKANENLARELMELFSLGIGNYSEKDIKEGARALTGYTFQDDQFQFDKRNHDEGSKSILGQTGAWDGDDFVRIILEQKAVGPFVARKLYHHFVGDLPAAERAPLNELPRPQQRVVRELAAALVRSKYELKPVLKRLFLSKHFYDPSVMGEQIKSPAQLVVGAIRSLDTPARDLGILNDALDLMGQNLFFPPSVKGWDGGRSWINTSTFFVRQNIMAYLLTGKKPRGYDANADEMKYDPMALLGELAKAEPGAERDAGRVADYLLRLTIGRAPTHARAALDEFLKRTGGRVERDVVVGLLLLITAMPEYQLC